MKICTACLNRFTIIGFYKNGTTMGYCKFCNCYDVVNVVISASELEKRHKNIDEIHPFVQILRKHINNIYLEKYVVNLDEEEFYYLMHGLTS